MSPSALPMLLGVILACTLLPDVASAQSVAVSSAPPALDSPKLVAAAVPLSAAVNEGSLFAEISGAVLGDLVGMGVSAAFVLRWVCIGCEQEGPRDDTDFERVMVLSLLARPLLVGGFTGWFSRPSGGEGRTYAAILGALPGAALTGAGWLISYEGSIAGPALVLANVLSVGGAVAAYRYSARRNPREHAEPEPRFTPGAYFDAEARSAGLTLSGRF